MKTLIGRDDHPVPAEEVIIERLKAARVKALETVDWCLRNSALRSRHYAHQVRHAPTPEKVTAAARDLEIERAVQNRLLAERKVAAR